MGASASCFQHDLQTQIFDEGRIDRAQSSYFQCDRRLPQCFVQVDAQETTYFYKLASSITGGSKGWCDAGQLFQESSSTILWQKKKSSTKKYATLYEINDGRAPDNNIALFGVNKRRQEVVIIDDGDKSKPNAKKAKRQDVQLNAALEEYLDEVDKTCLKVGAVKNDDVMDEKLFLELLQTGDVELVSEDADNEFERTDDLDKDIKNMFNGKDNCCVASNCGCLT